MNDLSKNSISEKLTTAWVGKEILYYDQIGSTNTTLGELARDGLPDGSVCVADMQTSGKGRRGRTWLQEPGSMISMSILLRPAFPIECASMITLIAAMAVSLGLEKQGLDVNIKWPNDILINNKKICGILTELFTLSPTEYYLVVGIGINVNITKFPEDIQSIAGSIYSEIGKISDRSIIIADILNAFESLIDRFANKQNLSFIIEEYNRRLISIDKEVRVLDPKGEYSATSLGLADTGELIVRTRDGKIQKVYAGEVSVRGIYGYGE